MSNSSLGRYNQLSKTSDTCEDSNRNILIIDSSPKKFSRSSQLNSQISEIPTEEASVYSSRNAGKRKEGVLYRIKKIGEWGSWNKSRMLYYYKIGWKEDRCIPTSRHPKDFLRSAPTAAENGKIWGPFFIFPIPFDLTFVDHGNIYFINISFMTHLSRFVLVVFPYVWVFFFRVFIVKDQFLVSFLLHIDFWKSGCICIPVVDVCGKSFKVLTI